MMIKKKSKRITIISLSFIAVGLIIVSFLVSAPYFTQAASNTAISDYKTEVDNMNPLQIEEAKEDALKYNRTGNSNYYNALNVGKVLSYIDIPDIKVYLPIYEGSSDAVLESGVGHLEDTSLPIGGKGSHCVLAAHSGLLTKTMFSNLSEIKVGNRFWLNTLDEHLCYEVYEIVTVLPDEVEDYIKYDKNEDYCTLMTCTPIGINTHRLLIRGRRVSYGDTYSNVPESYSSDNNTNSDINLSALITTLTIVSVLVIGSIIFTIIISKKVKNTDKSEEK